MKLQGQIKSKLKAGDTVMVMAGGNKNKRANKGKVGKLVRFVGEAKQRVIVEGVNFLYRHLRQSAPGKPSGKIQKEGSIHISNVMYYVEKLKRPVRLKSQTRQDGTKVRGYIDPQSKKFVELS